MSNLLETMREKAIASLDHSYSPYSHFPVASCLRAEDDSLYCGCNVENASYGLTLCAERSAVANLICAGKKRIKEIVIVAPTEKLCKPCGACRQVLVEFADAKTKVHLFNLNGDSATFMLEELLPMSFELP